MIPGTRKRCPWCGKMVKAGAAGARLVDERHQATSGATPWIGARQSYPRGGVHLYHSACYDALLAQREKDRDAATGNTIDLMEALKASLCGSSCHCSDDEAIGNRDCSAHGGRDKRAAV